MQLISVKFGLFWIAIFIIYYLLPQFQWQILLLASLNFYIFGTKTFPIMIVLVSVLIWIIRKFANENKRRIVIIFFLIGSVVLLGFYRFYTGIYFAGLQNHVPLGVSFFALAAIGYCLDVHWERIEAENNIFKILLFLLFFPTLLQGPINRYGYFYREISQKHHFSWNETCRGLQRFLWGLFKKLVVAERLINITAAIFSDLNSYSLNVFSFGVICFAIELYVDFSGYMDMIIGISQTFGIKMPENFKHPYFSMSVIEFWRRWHITLGTWFKDYVLYAFVMSRPVKRLGKYLRKRDRRLSKLIPTLIGTMLVWILTGLWHGNSIGYMLWGLFYGVVICCSLLIEDFLKSKGVIKGKHKLGLYRLLYIIRTWIIVYIADIFICADSWNGIKVIARKLMNAEFGFLTFADEVKVLIKGNIFWISVGCIILFFVSLIEEQSGNIFEVIEKKHVVVRWFIWYGLIFTTFLFGKYGGGYDISSFLYQVY